MFDVITTLILILCVAAVIACQLLLCFMVKSKILRLLPSIALVILTAFFSYKTAVAVGWDGFGYLFLAMLSAIMLGVSCLCWIAFGIVKIVKKKRSKKNITE